MQDKRLPDRMIHYWQHLADGNLPKIGQFAPAVLEDIWPNCLKVSVHANPYGATSFTYDYMGRGMVQMYGKNLTGAVVDLRLQHFPGKVVVKKLQDAIMEKTPLIDENQFTNEMGKLVKYRGCVLPFGDEKDVSHIIAGMSFRIF